MIDWWIVALALNSGIATHHVWEGCLVLVSMGFVATESTRVCWVERKTVRPAVGSNRGDGVRSRRCGVAGWLLVGIVSGMDGCGAFLVLVAVGVGKVVFSHSSFECWPGKLC